MGYSDNIADNASAFGLTFLGSFDLEDEPWQFYILGIWKGPEGYYLSTDSGCSCPSPWENHTSLEDLTGPLTAEQAREEAESLLENASFQGHRDSILTVLK